MKSPMTSMSFDRLRVHADIKAHRPHCRMEAHDAMKQMWELAADAYGCDPTPERLSVAVWAWDMLIQRGCGSFDTGSDPEADRLSDVISVIVRG